MNSSSYSAGKRRLALSVGVPLVLLLAGCGGDEDDITYEILRVTDSPPVTLEVDVFSGRPNPTWDLTDVETRGLRTVLESLPTTKACPSPPRDNLGFRGFKMSGMSMAGGATPSLAIDADCVRAEAVDGRRSQYLDEHRKAERYLAKIAAERDPSLREALPAD